MFSKKKLLHQFNVRIPSLSKVSRDKVSIGRPSGRVLLAISITAILVLSGVQVTLAAKVATTGREIQQLEQEQAQLHLDINQLEQTIARSSSISTIEKRATQDLGMIKAVGDGMVVYIEVPVALELARR